MVIKIAVIGAGINGLTCAVKIKEKYKDCQVVLISDKFSPHTTGDVSGGLWYPYLCGNTPEHLLTKWGGETYRFLHELWLKGGHGICFMPIHNLYTEKTNLHLPDWRKFVFGYQVLGTKELNHLNWLYSGNYVAGQRFTTFIVQPTLLMHQLYQMFQKSNGQIIQTKVTSLQDPVLADFDVIVNCTGVEARNLVPDDAVYPIRGQVSKVIAPWINGVVVDEDGGNYIIPNAETCVLGGTHQENNYSTTINDTDTDFILNRCKVMIPGLKHAALVGHRAGLRPGRKEIRLEPEYKNGKLFIHNYGHGGSGFTLFWGCGTEVVDILGNHLKNKHAKL